MPRWRLIDTAAVAAVITREHQKTRRLIVATAAENQARIDALADRAEKAKGEIVAAIDDLKAQAAAGQELDFTRAESAVAALDDLNPDAPAAEPTPEPSPEPTPSPEQPTA